MDELSERRLKENEVIFQQANKGVADFIAEEGGRDDAVIKFYCECSNINCRERIPLPSSEYHRLHKNQRRFIALKGHEMPKIEKIVSKHGSFIVVEKIGEVPSIEDIDATLPSIAKSM